MDYGSSGIKCPFYKGEKKSIIKCEGAVTSVCTQCFRNETKKELYKREYCSTFKHEDCPYYKILNPKYK